MAGWGAKETPRGKARYVHPSTICDQLRLAVDVRACVETIGLAPFPVHRGDRRRTRPRRTGRRGHRTAAQSSSRQRGEHPTQRATVHLRINPHAHAAGQRYINHPGRVVHCYIFRSRCDMCVDCHDSTTRADPAAVSQPCTSKCVDQRRYPVNAIARSLLVGSDAPCARSNQQRHAVIAAPPSPERRRSHGSSDPSCPGPAAASAITGLPARSSAPA